MYTLVRLFLQEQSNLGLHFLLGSIFTNVGVKTLFFVRKNILKFDLTVTNMVHMEGLSGRVLSLRLRGLWFEHHLSHCVVSVMLEQCTLASA